MTASLAELLTEADRELMTNFERPLFRPESEVMTMNEERGEILPYFDPAFRTSRRKYSQFLWRLYKAGMIRWSLTRKEAVSFFFVKKKSGQLRLIIDARRVNRGQSTTQY